MLKKRDLPLKKRPVIKVTRKRRDSQHCRCWKDVKSSMILAMVRRKSARRASRKTRESERRKMPTRCGRFARTGSMTVADWNGTPDDIAPTAAAFSTLILITNFPDLPKLMTYIASDPRYPDRNKAFCTMRAHYRKHTTPVRSAEE